MAGVAEKARFYLEQAVPQLREFESKGIFSPDEIRSLVKKRTDYEHLVIAPGNKPQDWLNYVAWERSLETLRAKRCRRLEITSSTSHAGQGRVFGILERAVNRHPGNMELWKAYLSYAKDIKATKRYRKVMTRALRMHPSKAELWVMAGKRSAKNGDMQAARGFFMRGARFCARDATVWLQYARCELEWLEKMEERKGKKGGAEKAIAEQAEYDEGHINLLDDESDEDDDGNRTIVPNTDILTLKKTVNETTANEKGNPALDGAIPLAIYDICKKQPFFTASTSEQFFDVFAEFSRISVQGKLIQHVLDSMNALYPNDAASCYCYIRQPLVGLDASNPEYPKALRETLARLKSTLSRTTDQTLLVRKIRSWLETLLAPEDLDTGIRTVLEHTLRSLP
ncbi:U3 small nucleolar RNA-associated protein 6-domain-containing protein [Xylariaceae sp. FL1272]|nr:U3 small nucleolar RNA-associated protein 6-domain-containing protein [Xylariaceae sp. FL1272]